MAPDVKKHLLRVAMLALLVAIWLFFLAQPEDKVWWFWLVPVVAVSIFYNLIRHYFRCGHCGQDFGLKKVGEIPGGWLESRRLRMVCVACGREETRIAGGGYGGGGGGGP